MTVNDHAGLVLDLPGVRVKMLTCVICGFRGHGGLGYWAWHYDSDTTPVCRGPCWRKYEEQKKAFQVLQEWGEDGE